MRKKWLVIVGVIVLVVAGTMLLWRLARPSVTVEVAYPKKRKVVELVIASGRLRAKTVSNVGSEVTGNVESVRVDEGDNVTAGQVLITLERADAQEQLRQAQLAVQTARNQLAVVSRGPLPEEVTRAKAQLAQAERVGKAKVAAAQERVKELKRGGRKPERRRAQAQLAQATAARFQAEADLRRAERLSAQGAIPAADLDRARTAAAQAREAERAAREALALANEPASAEQIAAAQANLRAEQADYQESVNIAEQNLDLLLRGARSEDIQLAQARVSEAEAAVTYAQEQLAKRIIKSPITGVITTRTVEPGQSVTPGQTLLVVADLINSEIYVETDETNLPKLRTGQTAVVIPPSYPQQPFNARVSQIGPEVNTERGVVAVRLKPLSLPAYARPDMTVDVSIEVANLPSVWSVPASSLLMQGNDNYVLVAQGGIARRRDVTVLAQGSKYVGLGGIKPGDQVIVNATEVSPGQRVRIVGGG